MKLRGFSTLFIVLFLVFAMFIGMDSTSVSSAQVPIFQPSTVTFNGTIDITASGDVIYQGTGDTSIVEKNGNYYTLEGNVYGAINIMHNNTVLNGQNFSISNDSNGQYFSLNISNASNLTVKYLKIDTAYRAGIFVNISSNDTFSYLNVSSAFVSLLVGAHTNHLLFMNSDFSLNISKIVNTSEANTIVTGSLPSANFAAFVNSSSNIEFSNDTISNTALQYYGNGALINSANTMFDNVTLNLFTSYGILTDKNNTTIMNSHFNGYAEYGIYVTPFASGMLSNIDVIHNTFNFSAKNLNYGSPIEAIYSQYTDLTMKGNEINIGYATPGDEGSLFYALISSNSNLNLINNSIQLKNTGGNIAIGLYVSGCNVSLTGNRISMINTENDTNYAVKGDGSNITAISNSILYQSNSPLNIGTGIYSDGGTLIAKQNSITASGAYISGIFVERNSILSITGNIFDFSNSTILEGMSINLLSSSSEYNVSGNAISETNASISEIGLFLYEVKNLTMQNNKVSLAGESVSQYYALNARVISFSKISGNSFSGPSNSSGSYGIFLYGAQNSTFSNNTLSNYNTTLYSSRSANLSFYGNYFSNSFISLNLTSTNNSIFFHNDFFVKNNHSFQISSSSDDSFDLPLPIGGNYWSSYTGTDKNNNGIGGSTYTVNGTFVDHYPLMKPWNRPVAIFFAPSGLNGTLWAVTFNGKTLETTGTEITFNILNATYQNYSFDYHNTSLYYTSLQMGYFNYNGTGITVNIPYLHYSYITGDLNIQNFTVYINGKPVSVDNGQFNLTVTAGQYNVVIKSPGYATFTNTYNLTPGTTLDINATLDKIPPNNFILILEYVAVIIAVLVVVGGLALYMRVKKK
jgi:hypothetical protein